MITALLILTIAGLIDGTLEGYQFDGRGSFERKFKVKPTGFFGSLSWKRKYERPNIWNRYLGVFDFYHVADDLRKAGYLAGGILTALTFENLLIGAAVAWTISATAKRAGLWWIRK